MRTVIKFWIVLFFLVHISFAQKPYRVGTTTANFLEIGYGGAGAAMGDAYVSMANDLSSAYWNPAGLAFMEQNEVQFNYQPWFADINTNFAGAAITLQGIGTLAATAVQVSYGDMQVTNMEMQDGTGELFSANDLAVSLSYGRPLAQWFSFGASVKYISSKIWHTQASAMAVDLGVIVNTHFFSPSGDRKDGLKLGMSISNYGTKMRFDGIDLLFPIDIAPNQEGNYRDVEGQFRAKGWELPLIFRFGASLKLLNSSNHQISLAADALHPNNNSESVNVGVQYEMNIPTTGKFFLRSGYKALFMPESEFGISFGGGFHLFLMNNMGLKVDYAYRGVGILGKAHVYSLGILF